MIPVEVCTGSIGDSVTAWSAGASRLELNSGLETGGLTPSPGAAEEVIGEVTIPVLVMIRPRSGDFIYSPLEKRAMLKDIETFLKLGASGVVFGSLTEDGGVDREMTALVRSASGDSQVVFHRAFDFIPRRAEAATILSDLGIDRILTSGGKATAWQGRDALKELVEGFGSFIEILPASGINSANALRLVKHTGCTWVHGSFSGTAHRETRGILPSSSPGISVRELESVIRSLKDLQ